MVFKLINLCVEYIKLNKILKFTYSGIFTEGESPIINLSLKIYY